MSFGLALRPRYIPDLSSDSDSDDDGDSSTTVMGSDTEPETEKVVVDRTKAVTKLDRITYLNAECQREGLCMCEGEENY